MKINLYLAVGLALIGLLLPLPAEAHHFTCRASALRIVTLLLSLEPLVANPQDDPCHSDSKEVLDLNQVLGISATTLNATTVVNPNPGPASAVGSAANVQLLNVLNLVNASAAFLSARARAQSVGGVCMLSGFSSVSNANIMGKSINALTIPLDIPVRDVFGNQVATLHLNARLGGPNPTIGPPNATMLTQRALWLQVTNSTLQAILSEVVIGEATVDLSGNPCGGP